MPARSAVYITMTLWVLGRERTGKKRTRKKKRIMIKAQ